MIYPLVDTRSQRGLRSKTGGCLSRICDRLTSLSLKITPDLGDTILKRSSAGPWIVLNR